MKKLLFLGFVLSIILMNCTEDDLLNPYDDVNDGDTPLVIDTLSATSFAKIYGDILFPSCNVSGCHDGTIPPDFRTVESAYNTLVYHPIILSNPEETFTYRVVPYDTANSVLHERLTNCCFSNPSLNNRMPLTEAKLKKGDIDKISEWIMEGAKDPIMGSTPDEPNALPNVKWFMAIKASTGDTIFSTKPQNPTQGDFLMPSNELVRFFFQVNDDLTDNKDMLINGLSLFENINYTGTPAYVDPAIWNQTINRWEDTLNTNTLESGTYFMRYTINDGDNPEDVETPNNESTTAEKEKWSFTIAD